MKKVLTSKAHQTGVGHPHEPGAQEANADQGSGRARSVPCVPRFCSESSHPCPFFDISTACLGQREVQHSTRAYISFRCLRRYELDENDLETAASGRYDE